MNIVITERSLLPIRRDKQVGAAFTSGGGGGGGGSALGGLALSTDLTLYAKLADPTFSGTVILPSTTSIGTVSSTEIGYLDGVTSAIQTQLGLLAPLASPTFTGLVTTPALKVTTGAAAGNMLISDADGDLSYLAAGATTKILVGGGAAVPVWTEATGTGAPVRAGSPTFTGSVKTESLESTTAFSAGFAGDGYKVVETGGISSLEVDQLTVRGLLKVYELQINKISSVNGGMIISIANAKCTTVSGTTIYFDEGIGLTIPFVVNDYIKAQQFNGTGVAAYLGKVTAVNAGNVVATTISGTPWNGMDLVQLGNSATATRQSAIYLTAADTNNPYIEGHSGITAGVFTDATRKFRLGNLTGITDATLSPSGFGLYAQNVFLSGKIVASAGTIGGFTITANELYAGSGTTRVEMQAAGGFWAGATAFADAQFSVSPAGAMKALGVVEFGTSTAVIDGATVNIAIKGIDIWENAYDGDGSAIRINYKGYAGGFDHFRGLYIYNGKAFKIFTIIPSSATVCSIIMGNPTTPNPVQVEITGTLTISDAVTLNGATTFNDSATFENIVICNEDIAANANLWCSAPGSFMLPCFASAAARNTAIAAPAEGMVVYNLATHHLNVYNGTNWKYFTEYGNE